MAEQLRRVRRTEGSQRARLAGEPNAPQVVGAVSHLDRGIATVDIARSPHRTGAAHTERLAELEAVDGGSWSGMAHARRPCRHAVIRAHSATAKAT